MPSIGCDYSSQDAHIAVSDGETVLHFVKVHLAGDLSEQHSEYFHRLIATFETLIEEFKCEPILWIEEAWVNGFRFPQAALKLARNAAVIELSAAEAKMEVRRVHISTWRKEIFGNGKPQDPKGTAKAWVLYNLGYETKDDNKADAACISVFGTRQKLGVK